LAWGEFPLVLCPRSVQPAVISRAEDTYQEFADNWAILVAEMTNWYAHLRTRVCFIIFPLWRFQGLTFWDLEPEVVLKWDTHREEPEAQSHHNLYMSHHNKNLAKPPIERTHLLVFEEDTRCVNSTLLDLTAFLEHLESLDVKWDLIYIGGMMRDLLPMNSTGGEWLFSNDDFWRPKRIYNTEAILINSQSIEKVAEQLKLENQPDPRVVDVSFSKAIEEGELIALIPMQRSCVQRKWSKTFQILFKDKDRRWYAAMKGHDKPIPLHSDD